jgi:hypothetical protein
MLGYFSTEEKRQTYLPYLTKTQNYEKAVSFSYPFRNARLLR